MHSETLLKAPSAWLPIAMSVVALAVVLVHIAYFGTTREVDEGSAAHIWQLLMALQVPLIAYFVIRRIARTPARALVVVALQLIAAVAAFAPVFLLGL